MDKNPYTHNQQNNYAIALSYYIDIHLLIQMYSNYFDLASRTSHATLLVPPYLYSAELIGAKSQLPAYPELTWDSSLTSQHSYPDTSYTGIPLASYVTFNSIDAEVIYTFNSNDNLSTFEDKPVAWKNVSGPNKYVYFDIPLSFFNRSQAIIALQTAVDDLLDIPTDINDQTDLAQLPHTIQLGQNYPNPFNPSTTIEFSLPEKDHISILVYNILGQQIRTLTDEEYSAGYHEVTWDGTNKSGDKVSSGIYLYKIVGRDFSDSKKMVLLK